MLITFVRQLSINILAALRTCMCVRMSRAAPLPELLCLMTICAHRAQGAVRLLPRVACVCLQIYRVCEDVRCGVRLVAGGCLVK